MIMRGSQALPQGWPEMGSTIPEKGIYYQLSAENGLPRNPFLIQKSVESFLGGKIDEGTPESRGKTYCLKITNKQQQAKITGMTMINDIPCKITMHPTRNFSYGVINCWDASDYTTDFLEESLESQNVVKAERLTKWVENQVKPTNSYLLKFKGQPPSHIKIGFIRCETRPYYPDPTLCKKCFNFGHPSKYCKSQKEKCGVCSGDHPTKNNDTICNQPNFCDRCQSGDHQIRHRSCPFYKSEKEILRIKVDHNLPYSEAKLLHTKNNTTAKSSYATIVKQQQPMVDDIRKSFTDILNEQNKNFNAQLEALNKSFTERMEIQEKSFQKQLEQQNQTINNLIEALGKTQTELADEKQKNNLLTNAILKITGGIDKSPKDMDMDELFRQNAYLQNTAKKTTAKYQATKDKLIEIKDKLEHMERMKHKSTRKLSPPNTNNPAKKPTIENPSNPETSSESEQEIINPIDRTISDMET